ncbi:MAG: hypothetical protein AAFQ68_27050 [Bacteroidota bacterium]
MSRLLQNLSPRWLLRLEKRWLLRDPELWATRIIHVLFWGLLGLGLALTYAFYVPFGERHIRLWLWGSAVMGVLSLGAFVWWWRMLLRYPAAGQAGRLKGWLSIRNLILFVLGSAILSAIPVVFFEVIALRWYEFMHDFAPFEGVAPEYLPFQQRHIWPLWLMAGIPILTLLTDMAAHMRSREFWLTVGTTLGLIVLISLFLEILGKGRNTALPLFVVMALVAQVRILVEWVFEDNPIPEHAIGAQVIFLGISSIHILIIPIAILTSIQLNVYIANPVALFNIQLCAWIIGTALAWLMWHIYFRPKVLDLYLKPPV